MNKLISLIAVAIFSLGTPAVTAAYYRTQLTIWQEVQDYAIPDNEMSNSDETLEVVWATLKKNLNSKISNINDEELRKIASQAGKENDIQNWCFGKYKEIYWSWFHDKKSNLREDVISACYHKISDQLHSDKFTFSEGNTNRNVFVKKIEKLKEYKDDNDAKIDKKLEKIRRDKKK